MTDEETCEMLPKRLATCLVAVDELVAHFKLARVRDIALLCAIRRQRVTAALRRLGELGLVSYRKGEYIDITESGIREAARIRARVIAGCSRGGDAREQAIVDPVVGVRILKGAK